MSEMLLKPFQGLLRDLFKCSRFFKQMRRAGDNRQLFGTAEQTVGMSVHLDDRLIFTADQQQGRRGHLRQEAFGKDGPSAA